MGDRYGTVGDVNHALTLLHYSLKFNNIKHQLLRGGVYQD